MRTEEMIKAHKAGQTKAGLVECIDACFECTQCCTTCADACLLEEQVEKLVRCIRLDQDCADMCDALGRVLSRQAAWDPQVVRAQLEACATVCRVCAEECEKHASKHEHCRVCAECCRKCEQSCRQLLAA